MQPYRCLCRRWGFRHEVRMAADFESPPWRDGGISFSRDDERDGFWT